MSSHLTEKGFQAHLDAARAGDPGELTPSLANVGKEGVLKAFGVEMWGWEGKGGLWGESSLPACATSSHFHIRTLLLVVFFLPTFY